MKKAQTEVLTTLLIFVVTLSVVTSVYFFGIPLIEKNKDIATLEKSEDFIKNLNTKIKKVANGGSDQIEFDLPGLFIFNQTDETIEIVLKTTGTKYAEGGWISLSRSNQTSGTWGIDEPEIIEVKSVKISEKKYITTFKLSYRELKAEKNSYKISLISSSGTSIVSGGGHTITITYGGLSKSEDLIKTNVKINIV
ncbi:MAG: hypothetical protein DRO96_00855 [Candidatus Aenigmatarchaeota archaeon]|nr:MAG: hypothetical protein B6U68_00480 [Candidatus Aenigmarchaeota archaeon ex4484_14]RLB76952.1 MAG: hypothetical protein DRH15_11930 [Deltaproteobacteria bacterium]RLI97379.1 MAG: hypothetical protein DRO96_00855 [Candidatus Aenigmarchaeota archaeon]